MKVPAQSVTQEYREMTAALSDRIAVFESLIADLPVKVKACVRKYPILSLDRATNKEWKLHVVHAGAKVLITQAPSEIQCAAVSLFPELLAEIEQELLKLIEKIKEAVAVFDETFGEIIPKKESDDALKT